jgi:uncharacterized protein involved in exopolysaccharide biosynthesis
MLFVLQRANKQQKTLFPLNGLSFGKSLHLTLFLKSNHFFKVMRKSTSSFLAPTNISLRGIATTLFRKKWLVLATFLTACVAASLFAWLLPDKYESRMKLLVRNMRADSPVTAGSEVAADRNEVSESQIVSEIELLKSRDLLEKLVKQQNLAHKEPNEAPTDKDVEKAVLKLEKDLQITPIKKANIIEITYTSASPENSASILNQLSELYLDKHLQVHHPPGAYDFFKNQADAHQQELRGSESRLSAFQQQQNVVVIQQQKELILTKLVEANSKLKDLSGTIRETDRRIAELQNQLGGMDRRVVTQSRTLPNQFSAERLNTMLVELRNRRIQLLAKFQPTDRMVREVDEQIESTTEALKKAVQSTAVEQATDLNPLRQLLESDLTKARVDQQGRLALRENLSGQVRQYEDQLTKLEKATTRHNDLTRQVKQSEDNYQLYAKKEEESRINDALDKQKISNVSVAEAPSVPRSPNKGNRLMALFLGLGLGLMISLGSAFASELLRETIATPQELEKISGYPVLATLAVQRTNIKELELEESSDSDFEADLEDSFEKFDETLLSHLYQTRSKYQRS